MDDKKPENPVTPASPPEAPAPPPIQSGPVDPTPPTPNDVPPASGAEPVPPKIQQHLDAVPSSNDPIKPHHTKRFWTVFLIVVIVLLLLVAAVLGYFLLGNKSSMQKKEATVAAAPTTIPSATPVPDPTIDWQNYTDKTLSFSFRFPSDKYSVSVVPSANITTALKPDKLTEISPGQGDFIPLEIYFYKSTLTADAWWKAKGRVMFEKLQTDFQAAQEPKPSPYPTPSFTVNETTLGGESAIKINGNVIAAQGFGEITLTIAKFKDGIYMLKQTSADKDTSDQIISTFTFSQNLPVNSEALPSATP